MINRPSPPRRRTTIGFDHRLVGPYPIPVVYSRLKKIETGNRTIMRALRRAGSVLLAAAMATAGSGCAQPAERGEGAAATVRRLATAVASGDGAAACEVLAPETRAAVQESAGAPCADAITEENLPAPGTVQSVDVYGQWARVVAVGDTVFLGAFGDGWRVVAAGCRSRGERPYDCQVQGE
jgi:hypothetical protein